MTKHPAYAPNHFKNLTNLFQTHSLAYPQMS